MNDPHVAALHYRLAILREGIDFDNAPPLDVTHHALRFVLNDGKLTVSPTDHYSSEREARDAVEPILRAWEIDNALKRGPEIQFVFQSADVIDRNPPPPGTGHRLDISSAVEVNSAIRVSGRVSRTAYPEPPTGFAFDSDVEVLYVRWRGYLAGREPLQAMAYFCLTVLELHMRDERDRGRRRAGTATRFAIEKDVLDTLGDLTSEKGDPETARKAAAASRPLTTAERKWLEEAVKMLIRRAGEVAAQPGAARPTITMADLPSL